jgi:hypothetical protein
MNKGSGNLRTANKIERELDNLAHLCLSALRMEWRRRYHSNPPKTKSTMMLRRLLAWRIQEEVFGGLSMFSKQRVVALSTAVDRKPPSASYGAAAVLRHSMTSLSLSLGCVEQAAPCSASTGPISLLADDRSEGAYSVRNLHSQVDRGGA